MSENAASPDPIIPGLPPAVRIRKFKVPSNYNEIVLKSLAEKKVNGICASCGANDWLLDSKPLVAILSETVNIFEGNQLPCALLTCKNCGYMRTYLLEVIPSLKMEDLLVRD